MKQHKFNSRWVGKFTNAFRGIGVGAWGQSSFVVHIPAAIVVFSLAGWFQVAPAEFGVLTLCVGFVFATEYLNSALEHFCRAMSSEEDARIRNVLDISSGAVLVACICAAVVGCRILLPYLLAG